MSIIRQVCRSPSCVAWAKDSYRFIFPAAALLEGDGGARVSEEPAARCGAAVALTPSRLLEAAPAKWKLGCFPRDPLRIYLAFK